ncbi:MAG: DUF5333 domain-containing protein [Pseudomonadota bacterium]
MRKIALMAAMLGPLWWSTALAQGLPPLKDDTRVQQEFLAAAIGDEIRKRCPSISARMLRVMARANDLERYALDQGYAEADIKALRRDESAKAWLRAQRDAYLAKNGVVAGDAASYCRLGMAEIERNSLTGWLLRAR